MLPWPFGRSHAGEASPEPEPERLEPIRMITRHADIRGFIVPRDERVTDMLQRGEDFAVLPEGASPAPENWLTVSPSELQLIVPPPWVSPPERRQARHLHQVFIKVGSYELTATAHLMAGAEHDILSRSSHPFLPLTDVSLFAGGMDDPERLDVVIVNLRETSEYRVV
jgi:hypothetical protein